MVRGDWFPRNSVKFAALLAAAGVVALVPLPAAWVDAVYSRAAYRLLQPRVTAASNLVPFALLDLVIVVVALAWIATFARDVSRLGAWRGAAAVLARTTAWAAAAYLVFALVWGFNYRRVPLARTVRFDRAGITAEAARRLADATAERLNALATAAHRIGWRATPEPDAALRDGLARAVGDLGLPMPTVARPKRTILDLYFRRAGVEGMTDPFFLETLVVSDLLPFERPFVIAHEWSHLAGLADESAANFAGWLACVHGAAPDQYSGWLFLYEELSAALPRAEREAVAGRLDATPRADLAAARARVLANVQPRVAAVAWRAYDSYLKSNRVASGTRSYDEVVQLVLGTTFGADWTPILR